MPIGCGDAPVFPGDVILGDSDGVIVIPAHLADEIANEAFEMTAFEDFVTEQVRNGRSIFGLYPATDEQTLTDFAAWRKKDGAVTIALLERFRAKWTPVRVKKTRQKNKLEPNFDSIRNRSGSNSRHLASIRQSHRPERECIDDRDFIESLEPPGCTAVAGAHIDA